MGWRGRAEEAGNGGSGGTWKGRASGPERCIPMTFAVGKSSKGH